MHQRRPVLHRILHEITMCYAIVIIPALLIYALLALFTDLKGLYMLYSILPAALVLLALYILHLVKPVGFIRFWMGDAYLDKITNLKSDNV